MSDPYTSHSTGKLKLKGVKDSKVTKKKHKDKSSSASSSSKAKDTPPITTNASSNGTSTHGNEATATTTDTSAALKHLAAEDAAIAAEERPEQSSAGLRRKDSDADHAGVGGGEHEHREVRKTEAERRWEDQRRKRLEERLKREGVKSHKERVQELNKYLSGLSEHHDMPKIGPG